LRGGLIKISEYRNQLEDYLQKLNIDIHVDKILDIGAGDNHAKKRVTPLEYNIYKTLDIDNSHNPDFVADINRAIKDFGQYDLIFCLEVFEYIWNPVQALININKLMKKEATAYISFPFIYPMHNPVGIDYLRYTGEAIEKLLKETGFSYWIITARKATKGRTKLREFYDIEGMHARKDDNWDEIGHIVEITK